MKSFQLTMMITTMTRIMIIRDADGVAGNILSCVLQKNKIVHLAFNGQAVPFGHRGRFQRFGLDWTEENVYALEEALMDFDILTQYEEVSEDNTNALLGAMRRLEENTLHFSQIEESLVGEQKYIFQEEFHAIASQYGFTDGNPISFLASMVLLQYGAIHEYSLSETLEYYTTETESSIRVLDSFGSMTARTCLTSEQYTNMVGEGKVFSYAGAIVYAVADCREFKEPLCFLM